MRCMRFTMFCVATAIAVHVGVANASPELQLGIAGGTYYDPDEDVVTVENPFTLYALSHTSVSAGGTTVNALTQTFYLSMAILTDAYEAADSSPADLGSIFIDGVEVAVTSGMTFGVPPLSALLPDLAPHGVYETWYFEQSFTLDSSKQAAEINTKIDPDPTDPNVLGEGTDLYYEDFVIDVSNLAEGLLVHFDLYTFIDGKQTKINFAPFSHDATSYPPDGTDPPVDPPGVPEPASLAVWATLSGLVGVGVWRRRRKTT